MTPWWWLALGAALLSWPPPSPARLRWRALTRQVSACPEARRWWRPAPRRVGLDPASALRAVRALRAELAAGARPSEAIAATARSEPAWAAVLGRSAAGLSFAGGVAGGGAGGTSGMIDTGGAGGPGAPGSTGGPAGSGGAGGRGEVGDIGGIDGTGDIGDIAAVLAREPVFRAVAVAWRLSEVAGVPLDCALEGVAADLGGRIEQRQAVAAALAGPRAAAMLLAALPILGLFLAAGMGAHPVEFLAGTTPGRLVGGAGVLLDLLGIAWTHRLTRSALRE